MTVPIQILKIQKIYPELYQHIKELEFEVAELNKELEKYKNVYCKALANDIIEALQSRSKDDPRVNYEVQHGSLDVYHSQSHKWSTVK